MIGVVHLVSFRPIIRATSPITNPKRITCGRVTRQAIGPSIRTTRTTSRTFDSERTLSTSIIPSFKRISTRGSTRGTQLIPITQDWKRMSTIRNAPTITSKTSRSNHGILFSLIGFGLAGFLGWRWARSNGNEKNKTEALENKPQIILVDEPIPNKEDRIYNDFARLRSALKQYESLNEEDKRELNRDLRTRWWHNLVFNFEYKFSEYDGMAYNYNQNLILLNCVEKDLKKDLTQSTAKNLDTWFDWRYIYSLNKTIVPLDLSMKENRDMIIRIVNDLFRLANGINEIKLMIKKNEAFLESLTPEYKIFAAGMSLDEFENTEAFKYEFGHVLPFLPLAWGVITKHIIEEFEANSDYDKKTS